MLPCLLRWHLSAPPLSYLSYTHLPTLGLPALFFFSLLCPHVGFFSLVLVFHSDHTVAASCNLNIENLMVTIHKKALTKMDYPLDHILNNTIVLSAISKTNSILRWRWKQKSHNRSIIIKTTLEVERHLIAFVLPWSSSVSADASVWVNTDAGFWIYVTIVWGVYRELERDTLQTSGKTIFRTCSGILIIRWRRKNSK